ncbi:hypothetical protein DsansV1_C04g0048031 [Dioscorea sansibarensis]
MVHDSSPIIANIFISSSAEILPSPSSSNTANAPRSSIPAVDLLADPPSAPIASKLIPPSPPCSASASIAATSSSLGGSGPSFLSTPSSSLLVTFSRGSTDFGVDSSSEECDPNDEVSDLEIVRAGFAFFPGLAGDPKRDPKPWPRGG